MSGSNTQWVPGVKRTTPTTPPTTPPTTGPTAVPPTPSVTPQLHTWTVGLVGQLPLRNPPGNGTPPAPQGGAGWTNAQPTGGGAPRVATTARVPQPPPPQPAMQPPPVMPPPVDHAQLWAGRAQELATARATAQQLKADGDAKADELLTGLADAEAEAQAGRHEEAGTALDAARPKVEARALAWPVIKQAKAAADKAIAAGLDLGGRRDTLQQEVVTLAEAGQVPTASTKANDLDTLVNAAVAWAGRADDIKKARTTATFLKSGGDPTADTLLGGLKAAEDKATAGDYGEATTLLGPALQAITDREVAWKALRQHTVEMLKLKPRIDLATGSGGIPGRGVATHALKTQWQAFDAALLACPADGSPGTTPPDQLAAKRGTLASALNALTKAYSAPPVTTAQRAWGDKEIAERNKQNNPLFQKVKYVKPRTEQQARLLEEFNALPTGGSDYDQFFTRLDARAAKAEALLAAVKNPTAAENEREYFRAYAKVSDRIKAAIANTDGTEPTKAAKGEFDALWTPFDAKLKGTADDRFTDCLAKLVALTAAANKVLQKQVDAALAAVDDIDKPTPASGPSGSPVPATNAERSTRAITASQIDPVILRGLPVDKKLAMLKGLRANGGPPAFVPPTKGPPATPGNKDNPERLAQRAIYAVMDLDPAFVDAEKAQRTAVVDELLKSDKAELQRARDEWPAMTDDQRVAVMEKVMKAHCTTMGFDVPKNPGATGPETGKAIVAKDVGNPNNNGGYDPGPDVITINTKGPLYQDFELMMDLIIHENSHNYQIKLTKRLGLPDADPNKLTKTNTDPPYTQALMFQANFPGGYVVPDEEYGGYQKQPLEDHSWQTGPKGARLLMKELAK